jgi:signal transduction histidine kinase
LEDLRPFKSSGSGLQARLLLAVGVLAVAAVAAVAVAARQGARQEFLRFQDVERPPATEPAGGAARLAKALDGRCCDASSLASESGALGRDVAVLVMDVEAGRLVASTGAPLADLEGLSASRHGDELSLDATRRDGRGIERIDLKFLQAGEPLRLSSGRMARLFVLVFPNRERDVRAAQFVGSLDRRLVAATALAAIAVLLLTWMLARGIVAPLEELRGATRDVTHGDLARRVAPRGGREVAELGRAFNVMADELQRQQELRRDLVHDVAHELRAPLTSLRCRLEAIIDGLAPDPRRALGDLQEEVLHLGRLVDDLQDVALAEARELRLDVRDVNLEEIARSAARSAGLEHDPRLTVGVPADLVAHGDGLRLRQVVLNLLTNADRHTPAGGSIEIYGAAGADEIIVEVRNTGSRLEPGQIARLFDRFYRTDPSRQRVTGGTGLGLAIVKHLVEAHGGRVWARSDADRVTVGFSLPAANRASRDVASAPSRPEEA